MAGCCQQTGKVLRLDTFDDILSCDWFIKVLSCAFALLDYIDKSHNMLREISCQRSADSFYSFKSSILWAAFLTLSIDGTNASLTNPSPGLPRVLLVTTSFQELSRPQPFFQGASLQIPGMYIRLVPSARGI